jgi:hypothetical protein
MYHLSLDQSTIIMWLALFVPLVVLFLGGLSGLIAVLLQPSRWWLRAGMGLLVLLSLVGLAYTTVSPFWYHRIRLEPEIAAGEEVFWRYEQYRTEHGRYPSSPALIDLPTLDAFDSVDGLRDDPGGCDGGRQGCSHLRVEIDGGLRVLVFDGLFLCQITNLERDWQCRDMR